MGKTQVHPPHEQDPSASHGQNQGAQRGQSQSALHGQDPVTTGQSAIDSWGSCVGTTFGISSGNAAWRGAISRYVP